MSPKTQITKNKPEVEQSCKPPKAHPQGHTVSSQATPLKGSKERTLKLPKEFHQSESKCLNASTRGKQSLFKAITDRADSQQVSEGLRPHTQQ